MERFMWMISLSDWKLIGHFTQEAIEIHTGQIGTNYDFVLSNELKYIGGISLAGKISCSVMPNSPAPASVTVINRKDVTLNFNEDESREERNGEKERPQSEGREQR